MSTSSSTPPHPCSPINLKSNTGNPMSSKQPTEKLSVKNLKVGNEDKATQSSYPKICDYPNPQFSPPYWCPYIFTLSFKIRHPSGRTLVNFFESKEDPTNTLYMHLETSHHCYTKNQKLQAQQDKFLVKKDESPSTQE